MNRFNLKSLVLGIGIGIIITAVAGMIYAAGRDPMEGLSKEQIMGQAEKYGMLRPSILQESLSGIQTDLTEAEGKTGTTTAEDQTEATTSEAQTGLIQGSSSSK